jgi:hypothetical protein
MMLLLGLLILGGLEFIGRVTTLSTARAGRPSRSSKKQKDLPLAAFSEVELA